MNIMCVMQNCRNTIPEGSEPPICPECQKKTRKALTISGSLDFDQYGIPKWMPNGQSWMEETKQNWSKWMPNGQSWMEETKQNWSI